MAFDTGNIQIRTSETLTERQWRLFGEELQREQKGFKFYKGTANSSNNGKEEHEFGRYANFDFVFHFKKWDIRTYENIPSFRKGEFTNKLKAFMWDANFILNIAVKRVGSGNQNSVMQSKFWKQFEIPYQDRVNWLICDFNDVLKVRNFGGIIYIKEENETETHHIFHSEDLLKACIGEYKMDWEGDPTAIGGGGYKAKTLLNKKYSVKFSSFEAVKDYIRSMADYHLTLEIETNKQLYFRNIVKGETEILPYSDSKIENAKMKPVVFQSGKLVECKKVAISCTEVFPHE
jgi:hypothetical protein